MRVTAELLEQGRTPTGGFTRRQLAILGVPWPPPSGWKKRMIRNGVEVSDEDAQKFVRMGNAERQDAELARLRSELEAMKVQWQEREKVAREWSRRVSGMPQAVIQGQVKVAAMVVADLERILSGERP